MPRVDGPPSSLERTAIALDSGSSSLKIGFCGEETPRATIPTSGLEEANGVRPMEAGVVTDWEAMETYWDHAFTHHLRINTEHYGVVLTANLWETKLNKERIAQSLFESFAVPAIYLCSPPVFELYAAGRENGVVLGSGADCTYAVMVHEGLPDPRTLLRGSVAGTVLTTHAASVLAGVTGGTLGAEAAEAAKIAVGCVAGAPSRAPDVPMSYTLPDGKTIEVPLATRIALAEPLFDPSILRSAAAGGGASSSGTPAARVGKAGVESCGLSRLVAECIRLRDRDGVLESPAIAKDRTAAWYGSVVLGGGSTCFAGIEDRLNTELTQLAPKGSPPVEVCAPPHREHSAWLGASILGSLGLMQSLWISKQEYDENGPLIVHRKCF